MSSLSDANALYSTLLTGLLLGYLSFCKWIGSGAPNDAFEVLTAAVRHNMASLAEKAITPAALVHICSMEQERLEYLGFVWLVKLVSPTFTLHELRYPS